MHEASLTQGLLDIIMKSLADYSMKNPEKGELRVTGISCEAGLLACFEPETLAACFEIFSEGTPCENARLTVETSPLACHCEDCGADFSLRERAFHCPLCSSEHISFQGGNGLVLKSLQVEEVKNG